MIQNKLKYQKICMLLQQFGLFLQVKLIQHWWNKYEKSDKFQNSNKLK